jgi:GDP-L-fucose synthase
MAEHLSLSQASSVFVAGHRGLVGSAIARRLEALGCRTVLVRSHSELDLCEQEAVDRFFRENRPEFVFLAAGIVGGILENSKRPAEFLHDNLAIQNNVIHAAWRLVPRSSCLSVHLAFIRSWRRSRSKKSIY